MAVAVIDYIFLGISLACIIICSVKGFVDSFFDKAAPVLSIIAAICFYRTFTPLMSKYISNQILCTVATFLAVFVVFFIVIKILQMTLGKIFEEKILDSLNHSLGFLFGIFEALAIIFLILILMTSQTFFNASSILDNSFFYRFFRIILGDHFIPAWDKTTEVASIVINWLC